MSEPLTGTLCEACGLGHYTVYANRRRANDTEAVRYFACYLCKHKPPNGKQVGPARPKQRRRVSKSSTDTP